MVETLVMIARLMDSSFELNSAFILVSACVNMPELDGVWLFHYFSLNIIALELHWTSGTKRNTTEFYLLKKPELEINLSCMLGLSCMGSVNAWNNHRPRKYPKLPQ